MDSSFQLFIKRKTAAERTVEECIKLEVDGDNKIFLQIEEFAMDEKDTSNQTAGTVLSLEEVDKLISGLTHVKAKLSNSSKEVHA